MARPHHNQDMDIDVPVDEEIEEESESVISRIAPIFLITFLIIAIIAVLGFGFVNLAKRNPRNNMDYIRNELETTSTTAIQTTTKQLDLVTTAPHKNIATSTTETSIFIYESDDSENYRYTTYYKKTTASETETGTDTDTDNDEETDKSTASETRRPADKTTTVTEVVTQKAEEKTTKAPAETTSRKTEPVQVYTEEPETAPPPPTYIEPDDEPEYIETAPPPVITSPPEPDYEPEAPETAPPPPAYEYDED